MTGNESCLGKLETVLITGATGQDGRLAATTLSKADRKPVGLVREGRTVPTQDHPITDWYTWDWQCQDSLEAIIKEVSPDGVLHLAAHHHAAVRNPIESVADAAEMHSTNLSGTVSLIHALLNAAPEAQFVAAASSQMFTAEKPNTYVDENTPIRPSTFYGVTKASTMSVINYYRQKGRLRGGSAILFNHESEYRPASFVTRTISRAAAAIADGRQKRLSLANIGAAADWCAAQDAVQAMLMMVGMGLNEDLIISSGKATFLKGLLDAAFETVGLDWRDYVDGEKDEVRPFLVGKPNRIEQICGWKVTTPMPHVMEAMVKYDQALLMQMPSHLEPQ